MSLLLLNILTFRKKQGYKYFKTRQYVDYSDQEDEWMNEWMKTSHNGNITDIFYSHNFYPYNI